MPLGGAQRKSCVADDLKSLRRRVKKRKKRMWGLMKPGRSFVDQQVQDQLVVLTSLITAFPVEILPLHSFVISESIDIPSGGIDRVADVSV